MFPRIFDDIMRDLTDRPVKKTAEIVLAPVEDAVEVVEGLTEGELREKAALRLGTDIVGAMALEEVIDWYNAGV